MTKSSVLLLLLSTSLAGCLSRAPASAATAESRGAKHVYRLDFVLTAKDESGVGSTTSFTLNLPEHDTGEMMLGKNVPLLTASPTSMSTSRQDVGVKIKAHARALGDNVLVDVSTELSSVDTGLSNGASSIRKMVSRGSALALAGKPSVVSTLDDDRHRYQLIVTATQLQ